MTLRKTALKRKSGSPPPGEPEYLLVGMLRRPHGVRGDMVMEVITDFPERLTPGTQVFVGHAQSRHVIASSRNHAEGLIIRFEGIDSPEQAGLLRSQPVSVSGVNRPPLPAGKYYHHQLLGLRVVDEEGTTLGHLHEILTTGANDVFVVVAQARAELLLPVIETVILKIDVSGQTIVVRVPDGLGPESTTKTSGGSFEATRRRPKRG